MIQRRSRTYRSIVFTLPLVVAGAVPGEEQRNDAFQMTAATLSASGSSVVDHSLFILGESITGKGQNASFSLEAGAAATLGLAGSGLIPGDADGNGQVDLADYEFFADCLSGPESMPDPPPPHTSQQCLSVLDFDSEGDVDLFDFARFQAAFTG